MCYVLAEEASRQEQEKEQDRDYPGNAKVLEEAHGSVDLQLLPLVDGGYRQHLVREVSQNVVRTHAYELVEVTLFVDHPVSLVTLKDYQGENEAGSERFVGRHGTQGLEDLRGGIDDEEGQHYVAHKGKQPCPPQQC